MLINQPLIALADDDAPVRTFLRPLPADSCEGAPGCLMTDLHKPRRSGFEVCAALHETHRAIPVIVITGKEEPHTADLARTAGAGAFFTRPFDESVLLSAVRRSLAVNSEV